MNNASTDIDRASYARYRASTAARLPCATGYFALLDQTHERHRAHLADTYGRALGKPLHERGLALANAALDDCMSAVESIVAVGSPGLSRARALLSRKFVPGDTLESVMARDCFHGVLPYFDGPAVVWLVEEGDPPGELHEGLRATLHHRFLHGPQRTRQLFFHELAVGHLLNQVETSGRIMARQELRLVPDSYATLPAYFLTDLAGHLELEPNELCGLHFVAPDEIEACFPADVDALLMAAAHLYFYAELRMVYGWKTRNGAVIEHIINFFCLPALEHLRAAGRPRRLRPNAGEIIDHAFSERVYPTGGPGDAGGEIDLVLTLHDLSRSIWELA